MKTADDVCDLFAQDINLRDESLCVVNAGDENLVLNCFGFVLCIAGERLEAIDDVISVKLLARLNI
jgi:hypothetical protein